MWHLEQIILFQINVPVFSVVTLHYDTECRRCGTSWLTVGFGFTEMKVRLLFSPQGFIIHINMNSDNNETEHTIDKRMTHPDSASTDATDSL